MSSCASMDTHVVEFLSGTGRRERQAFQPRNAHCRLREPLDRSITRVGNIKHEGKLRDHEDVVNVLVETTELDLPALPGVARLRGNKNTDTGTIDVGDAAEIDDQLVVLTIDKTGDRLTELVGFLTTDQRSAHFDQSDTPVKS